MASITHFSQKFRIAISRIFAVMIVLLVLFSTSSCTTSLSVKMALDFISFVMVIIAAFGRLWSLAYISGHKTRDLIILGPYSMVRNPLYLFSLIGAFGIGLYSGNIIVLSLIILLFGIYYPFVIRGEENNLLKTHGRAFEEYRDRTPMFIPRPSLYRDEPLYTIDTRLFRRAFFSVVWFPLIYILMYLVEHLKTAGVIPVLFTIP